MTRLSDCEECGVTVVSGVKGPLRRFCYTCAEQRRHRFNTAQSRRERLAVERALTLAAPPPEPSPVEETAADFVRLIEQIRPSWMLDAECRDLPSELFFLARGESTVEAKAVCNTCPVRVQCLDYALDNGEKYGVWGGLSEKQRRRIRGDRLRAGKAA